jgi:hypothetical protein
LPIALSLSGGERKWHNPVRKSGTAKFIADNLSKAGWRWGCVSAVDSNGRTIWIVDGHRDDGQRFVVHADEKLTAFLELESAIRESPSFTHPCIVKRHSAGTETYD